MTTRQALLYGLTKLTKKHEAELEVIELKMLRSSLGVTRMSTMEEE